MTVNLLLDTDVYIDYVGRREPFFEDARRIVVAGYLGDVRLWVPTFSLQEAFRVLRRHADPVRIQRAMAKTSEALTPVGLSAGEAVRAARLEWDDYEKCLVSLCAGKAKAYYLVTRDPAAFARSLIPVATPGEWLRTAERDLGLARDPMEP